MALTFTISGDIVGVDQPAHFPFFVGAIDFSETIDPHPNGTPAESHCLLALDRLLSQFKGKDGIEGLICSIATRGTFLEQALINVSEFRSLDTALGEQLDQIGLLYRELRRGKDDDDYRAFLRASAVIVGSKGRPDEMLDALVFLDNGFDPASISLVEHYPASFIMTAKVPFGSQSLGEEFARVLRKIVPAGVKFVLLFEYPVTTSHFVWTPDSGGGFAEESSPSATGGVWAEGI